MGKFVKVALKKDVPEGGALTVTANGKTLALFCVEGQFFCIDNNCTHASGPLAEGSLEGTTVTCPWHGATFDVTTGKVLGAPAFDDVGNYPVQVEGEEIKIEI